MTDAAKRVIDALAEVVHQRRLTDMYGDDEKRMGLRQAAFKRLWVAYDDYERGQPPIDHGYRHE